MIWLTWRQFRGQAVTGAVGLAALAAFLIVLGRELRESYADNVECGIGCSISAARNSMQNEFSATMLLAGLLVVAVPALIGAFWGAPLIARELETGTHRLVWNQSVTRSRWLTVKLAVVVLAGVALSGALSALFTWAAGPYDKVFGTRFEPLLFPTRNIVPLGYAVFAIVAGAAVGLLARRTVLAMAVTLGAFAVLQILMPTVIRPHLLPPVVGAVPFDPAASEALSIRPDGKFIVLGQTVPGAWVLTAETDVTDAAGNPVGRAETRDCFEGTAGGPPDVQRHQACLQDKDLYVRLTYQPADRYWTFQWLELTVYLMLAGLLAGWTRRRLTRGVN